MQLLAMCPMLFELQQDRPCRSVYDTKLAKCSLAGFTSFVLSLRLALLKLGIPWMTMKLYLVFNIEMEQLT